MTVAGIHLERLWDFKESQLFDNLLKNVEEYKIDPRCFTDSEIAYLTSEFESFLVQARAFINVAQIHTLDACCIKFGGLLTNEKYDKIVMSEKLASPKKLIIAKQYFDEKVFSKDKWGFLLKSLRDRVVHFDRIRPTKINDNNFEQLSVVGLSLEKLAQEFENGSYYLLVDVIAPIWDREWISGPFKKDMWK